MSNSCDDVGAELRRSFSIQRQRPLQDSGAATLPNDNPPKTPPLGTGDVVIQTCRLRHRLDRQNLLRVRPIIRIILKFQSIPSGSEPSTSLTSFFPILSSLSTSSLLLRLKTAPQHRCPPRALRLPRPWASLLQHRSNNFHCQCRFASIRIGLILSHGLDTDLKRWCFESRLSFGGGLSQLRYRQKSSAVLNSPMTVRSAS